MSDEATQSRWTFNRAGGLAGLVAAVLILVSAVLGGGAPNEPTSSDRDLIEFYADSRNQFKLYVSALVGLAASSAIASPTNCAGRDGGGSSS